MVSPEGNVRASVVGVDGADRCPRGAVLIAAIDDNREDAGFAKVRQPVEHGQSGSVITIAAHVGVMNDRNGGRGDGRKRRFCSWWIILARARNGQG